MSFTFHHLFTLLIGTLTTLVFFSSCEKEEIVVPEACFTTSNTFINSGDSVVFTNCSVADNVVIFITTQANEDIHSGPGYTFDSNNTYSHVFSQSGIFTATVRASNNQARSPIILEKETITVN